MNRDEMEGKAESLRRQSQTSHRRFNDNEQLRRTREWPTRWLARRKRRWAERGARSAKR